MQQGSPPYDSHRGGSRYQDRDAAILPSGPSSHARHGRYGGGGDYQDDDGTQHASRYESHGQDKARFHHRSDDRDYRDYRERERGGGYRRDGSGGHGGSTSRPRSRSPVRPLDRRAIEAGRRQREMERAERARREARGESVGSVESVGKSRGGRGGGGGREEVEDREARGDSRRRRRSREDEVDGQRRRRREYRRDGEVEEDDREKRRDGEEEEEVREQGGDAIETEDVPEDMAAMFGFAGFGTTKNQQVKGNVEGAASVKQQRTWRQYMNRRGGFNRPLDPVKAPKAWH